MKNENNKQKNGGENAHLLDAKRLQGYIAVLLTSAPAINYIYIDINIIET